jgi:oxygen-independent coproporphyrinogen-3 oxidase
MRGIELTPDDLLRRAVIMALMCQGELSIESIERSYLVDFKEYFKDELEQLSAHEADGLICMDRHWISVTPLGRLFVRGVCMVFDRYLRAGQRQAHDSRVI